MDLNSGALIRRVDVAGIPKIDDFVVDQDRQLVFAVDSSSSQMVIYNLVKRTSTLLGTEFDAALNRYTIGGNLGDLSPAGRHQSV